MTVRQVTRAPEGRAGPSANGVAWRVAAVVGVVLVPWSVVLAVTLPPTYEAVHWRVAWVGLDFAIAVGAGLTAWLLYRQDPRAILTTVAVGTLLLADAWFDVTTAAPGPDQTLAFAMALVLEIPLALAAYVVGYRLVHSATRPSCSEA